MRGRIRRAGPTPSPETAVFLLSRGSRILGPPARCLEIPNILSGRCHLQCSVCMYGVCGLLLGLVYCGACRARAPRFFGFVSTVVANGPENDSPILPLFLPVSLYLFRCLSLSLAFLVLSRCGALLHYIVLAFCRPKTGRPGGGARAVLHACRDAAGPIAWHARRFLGNLRSSWNLSGTSMSKGTMR